MRACCSAASGGGDATSGDDEEAALLMGGGSAAGVASPLGALKPSARQQSLTDWANSPLGPLYL